MQMLQEYILHRLPSHGEKEQALVIIEVTPLRTPRFLQLKQ
jgi:hypothetical protein